MPPDRTLWNAGSCWMVAAAWLMAGCGLVAGDFAPVVENRCGGPPACRGAVCDERLGICVASNAPSVSVLLRYSYLTGTSGMVREVDEVSLGASGPGTIVVDLPRPAPVLGWIRGTRPDLPGAPAEYLSARITFSRREATGVPGEPPDEVIVDAATEFLDGHPATFLTSLLPGSYDVFVDPQGDSAGAFAPAHGDLTVGASESWFTLDYDALPAPRVIRGYVTRSDGEPVPLLGVRAEDPLTGRRISTVDETAAIATRAGDPGAPPPPPAGFFEIFVAPDVGVFRLVVAPTAGAPTFPRVVFSDLDFAALDADGDDVVNFDPAGFEQPALVLPPLGRLVCFEGKVECTEIAGLAAAPLFDGTVRFARTFETPDPRVTAVLDRVAGTSEAGEVTAPSDSSEACGGIWLPEGEYAVTVTPPANSGCRSAYDGAVPVTVPAGAEPVLRGRLFSLEPRAVIHGTVLDRLGEGPAGSLPVEAVLEEPAEVLAGANANHLNRVVSGSSDAGGGFGLRVEPGRHRFVVRPPDSSGFPWRIVRGVVAPDGGTVVSVEAPVAHTGAVTVGGAPAPGVTIDAFYVPEGSSSAIAVAHTQTDASGSFVLLLPPSLAGL